MIEIPATRILNAVEGRGIEADRDDGVIVVFLDRIATLQISESPATQVQISPDNVVAILSGDVPVASVKASTEADAEEIAVTLRGLLAME